MGTMIAGMQGCGYCVIAGMQGCRYCVIAGMQGCGYYVIAGMQGCGYYVNPLALDCVKHDSYCPTDFLSMGQAQ